MLGLLRLKCCLRKFGDSSNRSLALAAGLIVRFAVSGLRFKHCVRTTLDRDLSSSRTSVCRISQSKDGMRFAIALPNYVEPGRPLLSHVQSELGRVGVGYSDSTRCGLKREACFGLPQCPICAFRPSCALSGSFPHSLWMSKQLLVFQLVVSGDSCQLALRL